MAPQTVDLFTASQTWNLCFAKQSGLSSESGDTGVHCGLASLPKQWPWGRAMNCSITGKGSN